jgi:magnesium transporter
VKADHNARRREIVDAHMVAAAAQVRADDTAAEALARLARARPQNAELVCVVDEAGRLAGALPVSRLFVLDAAARIGDAMQASFPRVTAGTDQEHAASLALHHGADALPVVDAAGRLLGVMPSQALLQVLRREHIEDLHRLAGIQRETAKARHAIEDPPLRQARHRLPWLLAGLVGAMLATAAMAGFESTLQANIAAAFFVPGLVYLADAIGTQSEAIAVRGLSLTRAGIGPLLASELRTGMLIGATLGALAFLPTLIAFGDTRLAVAVSIAIFAAGSMAAALGLGLPWLLARLRGDPALGSGPIATVIQDILSIVVYFLVLRAFGI